MIDLENFKEKHGEALKAAAKYVDRSRRIPPIPSDRWAIGTRGAKLVAEGIEAQIQLIELFDNTTRTMWADLKDHNDRVQEGLGVIDK